MTHELKPMPYGYNGLEPYMSEETLKYHHGKHHKGYVDTLNSLITGNVVKDDDLKSIISTFKDKPGGTDIFNNAAQVWNHDFFWNSMKPNGGGAPKSNLLDRIDKSFGGLNEFNRAFHEVATALFGSGWVWLAVDGDENLAVIATPNSVPLFVNGMQPLLACDVWEHAYYIDHRNNRDDFIKVYLENLVNWEFAQIQFDRALSKQA